MPYAPSYCSRQRLKASVEPAAATALIFALRIVFESLMGREA
jgi:hypothetical protein